MRFYTKAHEAYCGIDLHARTMYVCILNRDGEIILHLQGDLLPQAYTYPAMTRAPATGCDAACIWDASERSC